ncbi:MAG TPA: glycosyltransferase [Candidatus Tectomicrobia bacterium]
MKFLILNTDYSDFLGWLYGQQPGLEKQPYEEQMRVRAESLFGVADFYSSNLRKLGHEAHDVHANNEFMQKAWAREHGIRFEEPTPLRQEWRRALQQARRLAARAPLRYLKPLLRPALRSLDGQRAWFYDILAAQIRSYKPDILFNQAMDGIGNRFLREMKPSVGLLVGQIASPLPRGEEFTGYDLVISSLPNIVEYFRGLGLPSELSRFAFEPAVLPRLKHRGRDTPVSFVGSLSRVHQARVRFLEHLCSSLDVRVWGSGVDGLPQDSLIRSRYMGTAWGIEMYQILQASKMTLNHHIGIAESYANNMRLYEATGVGTLLITDWKVNLHEIFEPGREVVAYRSPEECAEAIEYYLGHNEEREAIARAGQSRTLGEHTYYQRVQEVVGIVARHVSHRSAEGR